MEAFSKKTDIFSSILKIWVTSGQFNSIFSFDKGKFNGFLDNKILFKKEYWQQNNYSSLEIFTVVINAAFFVYLHQRGED